MDTTQHNSTESKKKGDDNDDGSRENPANTPKQYCKFEVEKSSRVGLVLPQNLELAIKRVSGEDAGSHTKSSPAYYTSKMHWVEVTTCLPPLFQLFAASSDGGVMTGAKPVANFCPEGWQGVSGMTGNLEVAVEGEKSKSCERKWTITRVGWTGWNRHHSMTETTSQKPSAAPQFTWKGSMKTLGLLDDPDQRHKGNLKLETPDGVLLAAWKQSRFTNMLGSITIFETACNLLPVEAVVASCISVVMAERATGMNWLGGLGKSPSS